MFAEIKATLHEFGTDFDVYFHEDSLHDRGRGRPGRRQAASRPATSTRRTAPGGCAPPSTATTRTGWSSSATATPAYIAGDIAYFLDKRPRGFDLCIYMLGADHHGYIARLKAAAAALGDDPDAVEVLIGQMVNLVRDGQPVRMSKRAGTVITLDDLVEAVGVDAARYVADPHPRWTSPIDIDLELWSSSSSDNPVYYVQYAHARLASLARNAAELGVAADTAHLELLTHDARATLIRTLGEFPRVSRRPPSCASRTGSRATSRTWPAPTTGSTTRAGCCRRATRRPATCTSPVSRCASPPGRCWPTDCGCSASARRSGCERASRRSAARRGAPPPATRPPRPQSAEPRC